MKMISLYLLYLTIALLSLSPTIVLASSFDIELSENNINAGQPLRIELKNIPPSKEVKAVFTIKDSSQATVVTTEETYYNTTTNSLGKIIYTNKTTPLGNYTLVVVSGDRTVSKTFEVKPAEIKTNSGQVEVTDQKQENKYNTPGIILVISGILITLGMVTKALKSQIIHR